jgi:hypothetical protein
MSTLPERVQMCEIMTTTKTKHRDGITAEEKEKIFERGFGQNAGHGLVISREILAIIGITIKETGEPGKEARIEIMVQNGIRHSTGHGA